MQLQHAIIQQEVETQMRAVKVQMKGQAKVMMSVLKGMKKKERKEKKRKKKIEAKEVRG
jgi:hypothetical protein